MTASQVTDTLALLKQGFALHQQGAVVEAAAIYRDILAIQPAHFDALHLLGVTHMQMGETAEAVELISKAVTLDDTQAPAFINLGVVQAAQKDFDAALKSYARATALMPDNPEIYFNQGNAFLEMQCFDEARASYDKALVLQPNHAGALVSRGTVLRDTGHSAEALRDFDAAVEAAPASFLAHYNRGLALKDLNRIPEAEDSLRLCVRLHQMFPEAHVALAEVLFLAGKDGEAWAEYEWRWLTPMLGSTVRDFAQLQWDGVSEVKGKRILVHAEQGFGDTIQFARYVTALAAFGARVIFEVQPPLRKVLASIKGAETVLATGDALPEFDLHIPLMNLPRILKADHAPYLTAPAADVARWRSALGPTQRPRIGLAWSGRANHRNDRNRSIALSDMAGLLAQPFDFFSLQKDVRDADRTTLATLPHLKHLGDDVADFADTAAVIAALDAVVSVDTAVAHLAAAMGKPVFLLLPYAPDWRWGLDRADTPWYPSARLIRQPTPGDWSSVFAHVVRALSDLKV